MIAQQEPDSFKFDFGIHQKEEIYRNFKNTIRKDCNIELRRIVDFSVTLVNEPFIYAVVLVEDNVKAFKKVVWDINR
jgi:hypothetical protein